ncbi:hypothetical protein ACFQ6N_40790, partial [Kitasatospora sp. NPDC056446]
EARIAATDPASIGVVLVPATVKAAGVAVERVTDTPLLGAAEAPAPAAPEGAAEGAAEGTVEGTVEGSAEGEAEGTAEGAAEGSPWAVAAGVGVEELVAAVAIPPTVAMATAVAAMSMTGRIRMNPCPFLPGVRLTPAPL